MTATRSRFARLVAVALAALGTALPVAACTGAPADLRGARGEERPAVAPPLETRDGARSRGDRDRAAIARPRSTAAPTRPPADTGGACPVPEQSFTPPSVRLENVRVEQGGAVDRIVFVFGAGEMPSELSTVAAAQPPFFEGQSTNEIDVAGDAWIRILFREMLQFPATGEEVFVGPRNLNPDLPALQQLVSTDEFEGVHEWIAGYVGGGCVSLHVTEKGGTVTVEIEHGE